MRPEGASPGTRPTPERGEHTEEVLAEFGFATDQMARLRAAGAVSASRDYAEGRRAQREKRQPMFEGH